MSNPFKLDGQVAIVTGASRGIGRAVALRLGELGARVVGTATSASGASQIEEALRTAGIDGRGMVLDVTSNEAVDGFLKEVTGAFGTPGILVNNAGITRDQLLMRMSEEDWDAVLETNLKSVFRMSKAVIRDMLKARQGRIVSITSVVGSMGNAGQCNYAASKAGAAGFTRSLAREVGGRNITVNCVAPGFIDTDMTRKLPEEQRKALQSQIPLGRLGEVEDVANAVAFLVSPAARYITGETLHVNGGMLMA
ncbi:3-oxoacyl-ACP reductase FabG [Thermithiobacillus plumbiphilus]|uniref:3-oxoacyl-[acyl-carrier-protein] reductase n=1 Tax=Thermithiobacillus plumbiphilus TaxID=1729899 RepID=A0ABU9D6V5_9PROT